jgi:hypothetical protein
LRTDVSALDLFRFIVVVTFYCYAPFLSVLRLFNKKTCNVVTITILRRLKSDLFGDDFATSFV